MSRCVWLSRPLSALKPKGGVGANLEKGDLGLIEEWLSGAEGSVSPVSRITLSWGLRFVAWNWRLRP